MNTSIELLKSLVYKGALVKNLAINDAVLDRLNYELSIIERNGFVDYFITYSSIIEICNDLKLLRTYGRNTAPNSLVNYCLDICMINPIEEDFIFERFIHPDRVKSPDIDIDIPCGFRKIVIDSFKKKHPDYGVYDLVYNLKEPDGKFDFRYDNKEFLIHECGCIITKEKLVDSTFFYDDVEYYYLKDSKNDPNYESKIDILELNYLNKLQLILNRVGEEYHPYKLPLNDEKVFDFFIHGNLENIFQFNTKSIKRIFESFNPESIDDLTLILVLFQLQQLDYIHIVTQNKQSGNIGFFSSNKRVSALLKESYGVVAYQETFLHILNSIAGMEFPTAEMWRQKLMLDKTNEEKNNFSEVFKKGCKVNSSLDDFEVSELTRLVLEKSKSTFPKSHGLSYAIMGYWCAYYKVYFRKEFDMAFSIK